MIGLRVEGVTGVAEAFTRDDGAWSVTHADIAASPGVCQPARHPRGVMPCVATDGSRRSRTLPWREPTVVEGLGVRSVLIGPSLELSMLRVEGQSETLRSLDGDVVLGIVMGEGSLRTPFGVIRFGAAEYVWVPRAVPFRIEARGPVRALAAWMVGELQWPAAWRLGPALLRRDAPLATRAVRGPVWERPTRLRAPTAGHAMTLRHERAWWTCEGGDDPFARIGWEGTVYPVAFGWEAPLLGLARGRVATLWESPAVMVSSWVAGPSWEGEDLGCDRAWMVVGGEGEPVLAVHPAGCAGARPNDGETVVAFAVRGGLAFAPDGEALAE